MNAFDIASRRLGASARRQTFVPVPKSQDESLSLEERVRHSWKVAGQWPGVLNQALLEAIDAPGVLGDAARWQISGDAKRIRARLALAAGHAMGADMLAVVKVAAAVELLHEASLVHDDLQDRDVLRRGKSAVWVEFNEELAITLGDWMINQAYDVLLQIDTDPAKLRKIARAMSKAVGDTVCGQARENAHKASLTTEVADYIAMATGKTAPLLAFPLESVAVLASRTEAEIEAIRAGLECLGGAYQLRDDLIDLIGEKGRGSAGADFVEGKATLPLLMFYAKSEPFTRKQVEEFITATVEERTKSAEAWAGRLVADSSFDEVIEMTEGLVTMGHTTLGGAPRAVALLVRMVFDKLLVPVQRPAAVHQVAVG